MYEADADGKGLREEFVVSASEPPPSRGVPTTEELMAICRDFVQELKDGTPWVNQHISSRYVPMPPDPAAFSWWMAPVSFPFILQATSGQGLIFCRRCLQLIPIEEKEKAKLLPIRSPRLRLRLIVHWIEQLRSNW